jgi:hypothetical protein
MRFPMCKVPDVRGLVLQKNSGARVVLHSKGRSKHDILLLKNYLRHRSSEYRARH